MVRNKGAVDRFSNDYGTLICYMMRAEAKLRLGDAGGALVACEH